jgi:hypothetical protein
MYFMFRMLTMWCLNARVPYLWERVATKNGVYHHYWLARELQYYLQNYAEVINKIKYNVRIIHSTYVCLSLLGNDTSKKFSFVYLVTGRRQWILKKGKNLNLWRACLFCQWRNRSFCWLWWKKIFFPTVFRIRDVLVRIRILGSLPLD